MAASLPTTINPTHAGTNKKIVARTLETGFGDGYRQRVGDGINNVYKEYDVEWEGSLTDIDELNDHFVERAGYQSFTWTPPKEAVSLKWTCADWNIIYLSETVAVMTATLRQEFDV